MTKERKPAVTASEVSRRGFATLSLGAGLAAASGGAAVAEPPPVKVAAADSPAAKSTAPVVRKTGGADPQRLAYLDDHMKRMIADKRYPGVVTQIWRGNDLVHSNELGYRDIARKLPMTADTVCRYASMTKAVVSTALMQLHEQGRFLLDDPVYKYIPEWKNLQVQDAKDKTKTVPSERPMTVGDLLSHQSGLGGIPGGRASLRDDRSSGGGPQPVRTLADAARRLAEQPLMFQPGSQWNYGISVDFAGYLVEVLTGERLDRYLVKSIFEPLGMKDAGWSVRKDQAPRLAALYEQTTTDLKLADDPPASRLLGETTYFSGSGGMIGTANDYVRFARMLLNGGELDGARILGRKTIELMAMNHITGHRTIEQAAEMGPFFDAYQSQGFGLGFGIMLNPAEAHYAGSPGAYYWTGAFGSTFIVDPAENLMFLFMTQIQPSLAGPDLRDPWAWRRLRNIVYGAIT